MRRTIIRYPRYIKQSIAIGFDALSSIATVWLAFSLRYEVFHFPHGLQWSIYIIAPILMFPFFSHMGLYRAVYRYSSFAFFMALVKAVSYYGILLFTLLFVMHLQGVPRTVGILQPMMLLLVAGGSRALVRFWFAGLSSGEIQMHELQKVVIYGAGATGAEIAAALSRSSKYEVTGFIDDDKQLQGRTINGLRVYSSDAAEEMIISRGVSAILLAMPSVTRSRRSSIVEKFKRLSVDIKTLPGMEALADGKAGISDIRDVEIEDLLGRDPLPPDYELLRANIFGKVVMVTGAGGSIGSELCRQLLAAKPRQMLLMDNAEYNLYVVHRNLEERCLRMDQQTSLLPLLGDVTDSGRLDSIFAKYKPSVIYHAAAYKHVPLLEHNPIDGLRNNIFGTLSVANACLLHGIERMVLVSTDKAVRPTNVMGASKRICEMTLQALTAIHKHGTCFSMVRFGNVLGSSGSVVPLFKQQIKSGGPVTVTHQAVTRFFMTIPEAAQLVIHAGAMAEGGDVFLLDMGEPVRIVDLAKRMIDLSGLTVKDAEHPDGDIAIEITGLRPGEKLYEELLIGDNPLPTPNSRIFKANEKFIPWELLAVDLEQLRQAVIVTDQELAIGIVKRLVPEYSDQPAQ